MNVYYIIFTLIRRRRRHACRRPSFANSTVSSWAGQGGGAARGACHCLGGGGGVCWTCVRSGAGTSTAAISPPQLTYADVC